MSAIHLPWLGADDIARLLSPREATAAIREALRAGLDPASDPARGVVDVRSGQLLLMPSLTQSFAGVKVATVAPGNPDRGLPRIQALYLLIDADTLTPRALLDGTALTNIRTPAVSAAAVASLADRFSTSVRLVVFGAGPQAVGHVRALSEIDGLAFEHVTLVVRRPDVVRLGSLPSAPSVEVRAASDPVVREELHGAGLVVCATSAREPVFDSSNLAAGAVIVAVGSHEPSVRELDSRLMGRAVVVVEDVRTALREAGDVILAIAEGQLRDDELIPMADLVRGNVTVDPDRTVVFKSCGMSWEDIVVAEAVMARARSQWRGVGF